MLYRSYTKREKEDQVENIGDLWAKALENIEKKISKPSFDTWLKSTKAHSIQGDTLVITAPNEFARDWLEGRYSQLISGVLYDITGEELLIEFIIPQNQEPEEFDIPLPPKKASKDDEHQDLNQNMLNAKYTFDTFVIGSRQSLCPCRFTRSSRSPGKSVQSTLYLWGRRTGKNPLDARHRSLCTRT